MSLRIGNYVHKPVHVEAVMVTKANMVEVTEWCLGKILHHGPDRKPYIKVPVKNPQRVIQSMAFEGQWVVKTPRGWKVYTETAFPFAFEEAPDGKAN